jgi:hypothetical protein
MTDPDLDPILEYLREHSGYYSYSDMREQLLGNGYAPALVDRALAIYQQENPPTFSARESTWPKALLVLVANILWVVLVGWSILGLAGRLSVCGEILGGIVLLFSPSPKGRAWGRALLFGFLLTVALAYLLVRIFEWIFPLGIYN